MVDTPGAIGDDIPEYSEWGEEEIYEEEVVFKIVLMRSGESEWHQQNKIASWFNGKLSAKGREDILAASEILKSEEYTFDLAFCSTSNYCKESLALILEYLELEECEVRHCWQLNERHYGALIGYNRTDLALKYGQEQYEYWVRTHEQCPPPITETHKYYNAIYKDPIYNDVNINDLPKTESQIDIEKRSVKFWNKEIGPRLLEGRKVLIIAHQECLRSIVQYLDEIDHHLFEGIDIPRCVPFYYKLDETLRPLAKDSYLDLSEKDSESLLAVLDSRNSQFGQSSSNLMKSP